MINRRKLVLVSGALLTPLGGRAQQTGRPLRIGLVPDFAPSWEPLLKFHSEALAEFGRVEGRDYVYIRSGIFYSPDTQQALERVMEAKPDLIFVSNLGYAVAARKVTEDDPDRHVDQRIPRRGRRGREPC